MNLPTSTPPTISQLLAERRVLVCCGAGGVGKTTTAASLGIAGARLGRRVLVLTVDPSLRLAEALGVSRNLKAPLALDPAKLAALGVQQGTLDVWMLDARNVAETTVRRMAKDEATLQRLLSNRLYQQATSIVAGMHEYAAMEALHGFLRDGRYDLIVLDTPPSRNALDFLDAPGRLSQFLESKTLRMFLPGQRGFFSRAGAKVIEAIIPRVLGEGFAADFQGFMDAFASLVAGLGTELNETRRMLCQPDVAFLLVTSPAKAALTEALFFQDRMKQLALPFAGFILNRAMLADDKIFPNREALPADASAELASGFDKLRALARLETLQAARDQGIWADLALRAGNRAFAIAVPTMIDASSPLMSLAAMAERLASERRSGPRL